MNNVPYRGREDDAKGKLDTVAADQQEYANRDEDDKKVERQDKYHRLTPLPAPHPIPISDRLSNGSREFRNIVGEDETE